MARYFVTGATGFIGRHLVRQLVEQGHAVVALARQPARASDLAALGVTVAAGDITVKNSMRPAMAGVDGVFHLAGWYHLGARDRFAAEWINVDGTRNVLELMQELRIPRGVYTSTLAVNGDTHGRIVDESYQFDGPFVSEYDRTKWLAHYAVALPMMRAGLPLIIVQPGAVYGPGDASPQGNLLRQYLRQNLPMVPRGAALCWGHVADTARGHLQAMQHGMPGEHYIIAGPAASIIDVLTLAERITGVPAPRLHPAPGLVRTVAAVMSVVEQVVPVPETFSSEYLRVAAGVTYLGSSARAQRELGFRARPLEDRLPETLDHELAALRLGQ
jgi:nucleoside-diphosphate-sugar epimerase